MIVTGQSPREYAQLEFGFTKPGVQVWCKRHEVNVMHIDFEGAGPFQAEVGIQWLTNGQSPQPNVLCVVTKR